MAEGYVKATTKLAGSTTEARGDQSGLELGSVGEGLADTGDGDDDNDNDEEERVAMTDKVDTSPKNGLSTGNNNNNNNEGKLNCALCFSVKPRDAAYHLPTKDKSNDKTAPALFSPLV